MKHILCAIAFLMLPQFLNADMFWQRNVDALTKEKHHLQRQPHIAPFAIDYLTLRIDLFHHLSTTMNEEAAASKKTNEQAADVYAQALEMCFNVKALDITKKQSEEHIHIAGETVNKNDVLIIHTELVLSALFRHFDTAGNPGGDAHQVDDAVESFTPPFDDVSGSMRFQELHAEALYAGKKINYIQTIAALCNTAIADYGQFMDDPQLLLPIITSMEEKISEPMTYTGAASPQEGIPYQISIPHPLDSAQAIADIRKMKDESLKNSEQIALIEKTAHDYIAPLEEKIHEQQKLLAVMKSIQGMTIENEAFFNQYKEHFARQSQYLINYARAAALYCQLMALAPPQINYNERYEHIIGAATHIKKISQSLGYHSRMGIVDAMKVFEVLKVFAYTDHKKENDAAILAAMNTLHELKNQVKEASAPQEKALFNAALCNEEIALLCSSIEKGIQIFNNQTYSKDALSRYATVMNAALDSAQSGFPNDTLHRILQMQSAIPVVPQFDVNEIMREFSSKQYLLRRLRSDIAGLIRRIHHYKRNGIDISHYARAVELSETIKNLQPLYTVDAGRYKMNQNNVIIIDRQCASLLQRMVQRSSSAKIRD